MERHLKPEYGTCSRKALTVKVERREILVVKNESKHLTRTHPSDCGLLDARKGTFHLDRNSDPLRINAIDYKELIQRGGNALLQHKVKDRTMKIISSLLMPGRYTLSGPATSDAALSLFCLLSAFTVSRSQRHQRSQTRRRRLLRMFLSAKQE
jgi:hypothetical protein